MSNPNPINSKKRSRPDAISAVLDDPNFFLHNLSGLLEDHEAVQYCSQSRYNYPYLARYKLKQTYSHSIIQRYPALKPILIHYHLDANTAVKTLPNSIESLSVGKHFDHPLQCLSSLTSLVHLVLEPDSVFNSPLDQCLPSSLDSLQFRPSSNFDHSLDRLPQSIRVLELEGKFNRPLVQLPQQLRRLTLKGLFNQKIPNSLNKLQFLESIELGHRFNQVLSTSNLPANSLKRLDIGNEFNRALESLPESLESLSLGRDFNETLILPEGLKCLTLKSSECNMELRESIELLPQNLRELNMREMNFEHEFEPFPSNLRKLILPEKYNMQLPELPETLEEIVFGACYDQEMPAFSPTLTKIIKI